MIYIIIGIIIVISVIVAFQLEADKQMKQLIESNEQLKGGQIFSGAYGNYIVINENGYIGLKNMLMKEIKIINISKINGFDVKVNGTSTVNLGNAVVGGLIFGGVGAILGGLSNRKEKITNLNMVFNINDFNNPVIEIKMLSGSTKKGSLVEKAQQDKLQRISSLLEVLEKKYKS